MRIRGEGEGENRWGRGEERKRGGGWKRGGVGERTAGEKGGKWKRGSDRGADKMTRRGTLPDSIALRADRRTANPISGSTHKSNGRGNRQQQAYLPPRVWLSSGNNIRSIHNDIMWNPFLPSAPHNVYRSISLSSALVLLVLLLSAGRQVPKVSRWTDGEQRHVGQWQSLDGSLRWSFNFLPVRGRGHPPRGGAIPFPESREV